MQALSTYKIFLFLLTSLIISCNTDISTSKNKNHEKKSEINIEQKNNKTIINNAKGEVEYIFDQNLCFYSMSDEEYKKYLLGSNINVKWEFDLIFKRFKKIANNTLTELKQHNISSVYTTKPVIAFITTNKDTILVNRKEEDYFVGQIFFSGKDTVIIEQGLMKEKQLEEKIKSFFLLKEDFKVATVYKHVDTLLLPKNDSINIEIQDTLQ